MSKEFKPTAWAIRNSTSVWVIVVFLCLGGMMAYNSLPKEQFPGIVIPNIYIGTPYKGTSPDDIENLITRPIEKQLKSITGVKKIKSSSIQDYSTIFVEFQTDVEPSVAKQRVSDAVDKAKADLPTDMDQDPSVQEMDFSEFPIMTINVSGSYDLDILKDYAEEIQDRIEMLKEVTRADMIGALEKEVQINIDLYRMKAAGISFSDIRDAISGENINLAAGTINVGRLERTLRITGEFETIDQIKNVIIKSSNENSLYLRDIAEVKFTNEERKSFARLDRQSVIALQVIKRSGENLIEAADQIYKIIDQLKESRFPDDLSIILTNDMSTQTRSSISELINSIVIGFILVTLVLMFFMGSRNAVFVGLAVPISTFISFMMFPVLDYTFNIMTMFSFLLALGIIVDNAIVVIENTYRLHTVEGMDIKAAARRAASEVFNPVLAGTATTVAPFVPLLFWPGMMGEFMSLLPAVLIIVLTSSLFVAFVINPVFAVNFMKKKEAENKEKKYDGKSMLYGMVFGLVFAGLFHAGGATTAGNLVIWALVLFFFNRFILTPYFIIPFQKRMIPAWMSAYRSTVTYIIKGKRPYGLIALMGGLMVVIIILLMINSPKVEFFPDPDPNSAIVYIELPLGTRAEVTDSITRLVEEKVFSVVGENNPIVKSVNSNVGIGTGDPQNPDRTVQPQKGKVTVSFVPFREREGGSTHKILNDIRETIKGLPGTDMRVDREQFGPPVGKAVNLEISGDEFSELTEISARVKKYLIDELKIEGIENLKSDLLLNKPEILIHINREKANIEGVSSSKVANALRTALYGLEISKFRSAEEDYPIQLRLKYDQRQDLNSLLNQPLTFMTKKGKFRQIPISALTDISYASTFGGINRIGLKRVVTLSSNVLEGYNPNEINERIREAIPSLNLPSGYEIKQTGEQEDQAETTDFLGGAFATSIMLVLMILVLMFNSVSRTIIILTTIFFSILGVLLGYALTGMDLIIVMTGIGIISLAGIVVNNAILLIEFTDELRERGMPARKAIIEGGAIRFTPVMLTASSTMLGLIPLAIGMNIDFGQLFSSWNPGINFYGNDNTAFWSPMSWSIIFGLSFSTFMTLVATPALYTIMYKLGFRYKFWRHRKKSFFESVLIIPFKRLPRFS
jgi:multidrug efflux pump